MIGRTVSSRDREKQLKLLKAASGAWLYSLITSFTLIVIRLNFFPPPGDPAADGLYDGLTFALVIFATAAVFLGGERRSLSLARVTALGLYWVALSAVSAGLWLVLRENRDVLRFLLSMLLDHSGDDLTWVAAMFLAIQLSALPTIKILRESFSHPAGYARPSWTKRI